MESSATDEPAFHSFGTASSKDQPNKFITDVGRHFFMTLPSKPPTESDLEFSVVFGYLLDYELT